MRKTFFGKKFFLGFTLFALAAGTAAAQRQNERPWWYTLEQGKDLFRSGSYGDALITFEDARRERLARFTRMEQDFIRLLSLPDVRQIGDSLEFVESYIAAMHETAAANALATLYHYYPKSSLDDSVTRALEEIGRLKSYPEAEYWIGETYRAEGELGLALQQYERALKDRHLLETPEFDTEILYKITDTLRLRRDYQEMERRAREIIEGYGPSGVPRDNYWGQVQTRAAMSRFLENEGINNFLTLYRYRNTVTEKAHRSLGFFYYSTSRYFPATEHLMFAFLIQNTVIIDDIIRRQYDFTFTTLDDLTERIRSRPELTTYIQETEYYRTAYYLASALYATGRTRTASQLWSFLARSSDAGEWGERARRNPNPFIERVVEMP